MEMIWSFIVNAESMKGFSVAILSVLHSHFYKKNLKIWNQKWAVPIICDNKRPINFIYLPTYVLKENRTKILQKQGSNCGSALRLWNSARNKKSADISTDKLAGKSADKSEDKSVDK